MVKIPPNLILLNIFSGILAIGIVACSNNDNSTNITNSTPTATATPIVDQLKISKAEEPKNVASLPDPYQEALVKAASAKSISESAQSSEDWQIVSNKWQQAIQLLKAVPSSSSNYAIAKTKLAEYERQFNYARQKADPTLQTASATPQCLGKPNKTASTPGTVFSVPIKRREHRTVVIDVTFFNLNFKETYEMILDTGASNTLITPSMASALRLKPIGLAKTDTASSQGIIFRIACMDAVQVGNTVTKNIPVIIGSALDLGLLGQDFFGDYDVTIKSDVVEFRHR